MAYSPTDSLYPQQEPAERGGYDAGSYPPPLRPVYQEDDAYPAPYPAAGPSYPSAALPPSPPQSTFSPSTPSTSAHSSYNASRSLPNINSLHSHLPPPQGTSSSTYVQVHSYGPREGSRGTHVTVHCDVNLPPSPPISGPPSAASSPASTGKKMMRLCFGTTPAATKVIPLAPRPSGGEGGYELSAQVPPMSSSDRQMIEIKVQVLSETHLVLGETVCGTFEYSQYASPRAAKRPGDALVSDRPSPSPQLRGQIGTTRRRLADQGLLPGDSPEHGALDSYNQSSRAYPTRFQADRDDYAQSSSGYVSVNTSHDLSPSVPSNAMQPSDSVGWQSAGYPPGSTTTSPAMSAHLPPHPSPVPSETPSQPTLLRTSQLTPGVNNTPTYNAYVPQQTNKASLVLQGDLNTMAVGWDQDEWHHRRRLVQFWRRQQGSEIHAVFRPIHQEHFQQNSIVISCIYREDKNECFVTSVDAIYLLEALVGVRFTVEEKNRIRRNLEGFRPITVSKTKPGSEDFFKLIMSFPNPKPRNIEKDVKVFPWSIFGPALKKIISKYSASYTGALPSANYPITDASAAPYAVPTPLQPAPSAYSHHSYSPPHGLAAPPKHEANYRSESQYGVAVSPHPPAGGYYYPPGPPGSYPSSQFTGPPPLQAQPGRVDLQPVYSVAQ